LKKLWDMGANEQPTAFKEYFKAVTGMNTRICTDYRNEVSNDAACLFSV